MIASDTRPLISVLKDFGKISYPYCVTIEGGWGEIYIATEVNSYEMNIETVDEGVVIKQYDFYVIVSIKNYTVHKYFAIDKMEEALSLFVALAFGKENIGMLLPQAIKNVGDCPERFTGNKTLNKKLQREIKKLQKNYDHISYSSTREKYGL